MFGTARQNEEKVDTNLAQQHVLQTTSRVNLIILLDLVGLECFVEITKGGLEVTLLGTQHASKLIDLRLQQRRAIRRLRCRPRPCERTLCASHVVDLVVYTGLDDLNFNQKVLVVEALNLNHRTHTKPISL